MKEVEDGWGKPNYRVSSADKGPLTSEGIISSDRSLTNIDLSGNSKSETRNAINN